MCRIARISAVAPLVLLMSCAAGFKMVREGTKPTPEPDPDKATLVIMRITSYGFAAIMNNYLDGKFIGQTKGKCYFITKVDPGEHWLIGESENRGVARITFEAGKVYYLEQLVIPGVMKARTGWHPRDPAFFAQQLPELTYLTLNPNKAGKDMDPGDLDEDKKNFEKEVAQDPAKHRNTLEYKGF